MKSESIFLSRLTSVDIDTTVDFMNLSVFDEEGEDNESKIDQIFENGISIAVFESYMGRKRIKHATREFLFEFLFIEDEYDLINFFFSLFSHFF